VFSNFYLHFWVSSFLLEDQYFEKFLQHKLAIWYSKQFSQGSSTIEVIAGKGILSHRN